VVENDDRQGVVVVINESGTPGRRYHGCLSRGSGTDQQAHQDAEVVAGEVIR
jgi:hypothetical protein